MNTKKLGETLLNWGIDSLLPAIAIILVAIFLYNWIHRPIKGIVRGVVYPTKLNQMTPEDAEKRRNTIVSLASTVARVVIAISAAIMAFRLLFPNVDLSPFLASAGIVGIALGFGAQSLVKDVISGIFIMSENQYRVGDTVEIEGASGNVERVSMRTTVIRDVSGNVHFIPNGSITKVANKTLGYSAVNFTVTIEPDSDIEKVAEIINKIGKDLSKSKEWGAKIIEPPRFLNIGSFTDRYLEITIIGKTQPAAQWGVTGEMRHLLLQAFDKNDIKLAHLPASQASKK